MTTMSVSSVTGTPSCAVTPAKMLRASGTSCACASARRRVSMPWRCRSCFLRFFSPRLAVVVSAHGGRLVCGPLPQRAAIRLWITLPLACLTERDVGIDLGAVVTDDPIGAALRAPVRFTAFLTHECHAEHVECEGRRIDGDHCIELARVGLMGQPVHEVPCARRRIAQETAQALSPWCNACGDVLAPVDEVAHRGGRLTRGNHVLVCSGLYE